jgi:adenosylhomocysteine nucleosidase
MMQQTSFCGYKKCGFRLLAFVLVWMLLASCAPVQSLAPRASLEDTPRLAIVSAFEPEMEQFRKKVQGGQRYEINGRTFVTGRLAGHEVVLFYSGVSMVNTAMMVQAAADTFHLTGLVFSGIAGGVNPDLNIGDVVVPAEWAQYQESLFARETQDGWDTAWHSDQLGHYEMMFPQPVGVARSGAKPDTEESKFWFPVDAAYLDAARQAAGSVKLKRCPVIGKCLTAEPRVQVGGRGVSGPTFVDNAAYRQWAWENFQADALDMESAAAAHVAYTNNLPFIAFRSLSDLAGGGPGENEIAIFLQLAADNSAEVVLAFLGALKD